ncbi:hypothetical protein [Halomonas sp. 3A7M]|uniref:hypothetical protein n=1 Tax=Halomonas sp. 3A7M TaxID=2742616 RepID=UPI001867F8EC|nr:hypothetical protein [Halomonas sp. 3A7M]
MSEHMGISVKSIEKLKAAQDLAIFIDDYADNGRVYFIVALMSRAMTREEFLASEQHVVEKVDGTRWESADRVAAMETVQALRPEMNTTDFLAGYTTQGPYAYE